MKIFSLPEYLEYRYNTASRGLMAFYTLVIYVGVTISAVIYSGALTLSTIFDMKLLTAIWLIGGIAALYTTWGGLKAVAWADLFQGFVTPGILAAFVFGMIFKKTPPAAGVTALVASPVIYGILFFAAKNMAFLNRMAVTLGIILVLMALITLLKPLDAAKEMPVREGFENIRLQSSVKYLGLGIIAVTLFLYVVFW